MLASGWRSSSRTFLLFTSVLKESGGTRPISGVADVGAAARKTLGAGEGTRWGAREREHVGGRGRGKTSGTRRKCWGETLAARGGRRWERGGGKTSGARGRRWGGGKTLREDVGGAGGKTLGARGREDIGGAGKTLGGGKTLREDVGGAGRKTLGARGRDDIGGAGKTLGRGENVEGGRWRRGGEYVGGAGEGRHRGRGEDVGRRENVEGGPLLGTPQLSKGDRLTGLGLRDGNVSDTKVRYGPERSARRSELEWTGGISKK
ncbi:hypothetical protein B0H16DRAFT_1706292 [Mycena metata]|uniref:Uncharacterized protein n=1 Tax=Mycena metata TaxID=1033252 RepID=A0AAD7DQN4_9AGAR|nr:hypothetical protein B0H16DRAFT_1706292 [Mycena metata]